MNSKWLFLDLRNIASIPFCKALVNCFIIFITALLMADEAQAQKKTHLDKVITPVTYRYNIEALKQKGTMIKENYTGTPDENGILACYELAVPAFKSGCYFTGDKPDAWPAFANRVLPYTFKESFKGLTYGGLFLVLNLKDGSYLAVTPIAGPLTTAWFNISPDGKLLLNFGNLGTAPVKGDIPLFAWSKSKDVYTACREAWAEAITCKPVKGSTTLRENKKYPEVFKYLGWCSWEEYKFDISEKLLSNAVSQLENSGLPVRYMLVDDGHLVEKDQKLISFEPNQKFPNGWKPLLGKRRPDKVKWMGLWDGFSGYWNTISSENTFTASLKKELAPVPLTGVLLPKNNPGSALAFYKAYIGSVKNSGFDFVKIDIQASTLAWYRGSDNAVQAATRSSQAMEEVVAKEMDGLINCMAHSSVNVFNTKNSAITRCSIDYGAGDEEMGKSHIQQSYSNMLWLGQTVWGDHDMFHSSDPYSGELMAISKSMSGGPIYLSDPVTKLVPKTIRPLSLEDGLLLRPIAPATALPESIFINPLKEKQAYRVIAPLRGGAAAIVVYNLHHPTGEVPVKAVVTRTDYTHASALIQPYNGKWNLPEEGLVFYDWKLQEAAKLTSAYTIELNGYSDRLLHLCPIKKNWAVIGLTDKYLSPAGVETISATAKELKIKLAESGPFAIWSGKGKPQADGIEFKAAGNGLYHANIPVAKGERVITIKR